MFIGRKQELDFLEEKYNKKDGQFIVLYGRRRIGKTETLREFCKDKPHVFYSCRECTDKQQLKSFSRKLLDEKIPASKYIDSFTDWEDAFSAISELPYGDKKRIIVIDEFPYMCKGNPEIPSILQNLWDAELRDKNVMLILCGSAMSFIEKELLAEKNPLYGRATGIYKMTAMDFYDAIKFFPDYSPEDKITVYSILGGTPHYLKQFDPNKSIEENVKKNILTKGAILYSETEFMLRQELRETQNYNAIIEAIALGNTRFNDICQKSLIEDSSKVSVYLKNLIELGIVMREFPVSAKVKERANIRNGLYKLTDNFFKFWYAFGNVNFSELETGDVDGVYKYRIQPALHQYASFVFEDVSIAYLRKLQMKEELPFRFQHIGRWWGKQTHRSDLGITTTETEIDIMAFDEQREKYILGECKFKNSGVSFADYTDLKAKYTPENPNAEIYYYLFSETNFDSRLKQEAKSNQFIKLTNLKNIID